MSIQLTTLGGLRVVRDGAELDALLAQRVRCAVLVVLAVEGTATRDGVMSLLWPDRAPDKARHSLSQTLYELKKHLGPEWLEVQGEVLRITDAVDVDARRFEARADAGDGAGALELYRGPFLEGASPDTESEYGQWVERVRARLARVHRRVASARVAELAEHGAVDQALLVARTWVERDPLDDEAQHALIELLAIAGHRAEALRQYDGYVTHLARELGVEPLDRTRELVEGLRGPNGGDVAKTTGDGASHAGPAHHESVGEPTASARPGAAASRRTVRSDSPPGTESPEPHPSAGAGEDDPPETALAAFMAFAEELKRRRVTRVAIAYLVVALALVEGASLLLQPLGAPLWIQGALAVTAVLLFPVALVAAWIFDLTPMGIVVTGGRPGARRAVVNRVARRFLLAVTGVMVLGMGGLWTWRQRTQDVVDPNRVMVFPLVVSGADRVNASIGEDVATMIGHALDRAGPLRWLDGWSVLQPEERQNIRQLTEAEARALAVSRGCRYYVLGRVVARQTTATVYLDLWDSLNGAVVARSEGEGGLETAWQTGLRAVNGLLPDLVAEQDVPRAYIERLQNLHPAAAAFFLLGEQRLRRGDAAAAVGHYQSVLEADSSFTLAAVRGALAAAWDHDDARLLRLAAAARRQDLSDFEAVVLEGWSAFARGRGDAAVAAAARAAALDPEDAQPWLLQGEALFHTAPRAPDPVLAMRRAFQEANRLDPSGINASFHLLELALMQRRLEDADSLMASFRDDVDLDRLTAEVDAIAGCVRSPLSIRQWTDAMEASRRASVASARLLALGGRNLECAEGAFWGMLLAEASITNRDRRAGLEGLVGVLRAQQRNEEANRILDAASRSLDDVRSLAPGRGPETGSGFVAVTADDAPPNTLRGRANSLTLVHASAGWDLSDRSERAAAALRESLGEDFRDARPGNFELYRLGLYAAWRGDAERAGEIATRMEAVADTANPMSRALAQAVRGHEALARGDSAKALELFRDLRTEGRDFIDWSYLDPLPYERILEARLLMAIGDPQSLSAAYEIASTLDGNALGYLPYLPASLELRIEAARRMARPDLAPGLQQRLEALLAPGTRSDP